MLAQTAYLSNAPAEAPTPTSTAAPELNVGRMSHHPLADCGPRSAARHKRQRRAPDLRRVLAMTLAAALHITLVGALFLPETRTTTERPERPAPSAADASDRMTVFVDLDGSAIAPPAPPPPRPAPKTTKEAPPVPEPIAVQTAPASPVPAPPLVDAAPAEQPLPAPTLASSTTTSVAVSAPRQTTDSGAAAPSASTPSVAPDVARRERDAYIKALMAALLQQRTYPAAARKAREQGVVHVRFTIDRDGQVLSSNVRRGAGVLLDAAALEVLQRAAPLPPIPASMGKQSLTITVPIEYSLTTR